MFAAGMACLTVLFGLASLIFNRRLSHTNSQSTNWVLNIGRYSFMILAFLSAGVTGWLIGEWVGC